MKDENELSLPNFHRQPSQAFRRRVYVAVVVSLATLLVCISMWPISAKTFKTTASVRVRISPALQIPSAVGFGRNEQSIDAEYFLNALQTSVHESLSDAALASCIRRAIMQQQSGIAPIQIVDLRNSLDVRVARSMADPTIRTIEVTRTGRGQSVDQRVVNAIVQEISSRLSRKANYGGIQKKIQQQVDQVAMQNRLWATELVTLVLETRTACEQFDYQLDQLAMQLKGATQNQQQISGELQKHIEQVQQQVLTSDLQLLRGLREQMIGHFNVDETDGMVQHVERLISNREVILAQIGQDTFVADSNIGPDKVRSNPFMMASFGRTRQQENRSELENSQATLASIRLDETYRMLDQLKISLENPIVGQIPVLPLEKDIEQQPAHFLITDLQSARLGAPVDAVPSTSWLVGLSMMAGLFGVAFSLQWHPHQMGKAVHTPAQLAQMLGIEHMGTLPSNREKAGWLERSFTTLGGWIFRASEVCLLLILCGLIVAMIWDNQLPRAIAEQPVHGFCQAVWILFGRG